MARAIVVVCFAVAGLGLTLSSLSATGNAAEECVSPGGEGGCFTKIQDALNAVDAGGTVRVMAGTYVESIEIEKALSLLGGYDDATFSTRTPRSSSIDANGMDKVIAIHNATPVVVDGFTLTGGRTPGEGGGIGISDATVEIADNLIENNVAGTDAEEYGQGGGIYASGSTTFVTVTQNTIRGNTASEAGHGGSGGGMLFDEVAAAIVTSNTISANTAVISGRSGSGGGITFASVRELTLAGNVISKNTALRNGHSFEDPQRVNARGGGVDIGGDGVENENFTIVNNEIISNTAAYSVTVAGTGSSADINGGGIAVRNIATVRVEDNEISGNSAAGNLSISAAGGWSGGSSGGGFYVHKSTTATITHNLFSNNSASDVQKVSNAISGSEGGAMTVVDVENAFITGNTFIGNVGVVDGSITATMDSSYYASGGGVFFNCWSLPACSTALDDNLLSKNVAARIFNVNGDSANGGGYGGGLSIIKQTITLRANVFTGNMSRAAGNGGGDGGAALNVNESHVSMERNQLIGNIANEENSGTGGIQLDRTILTSTNDIFAKNGRAIGAWNDNEITLLNDTFYANGPVAANVRQNSSLQVKSSIVVGHDTGLDADNSSTAAGDYNLMDNNTNYAGGATGGDHDILGEAPSFVDISNDDYHLASDSPAIDAGDNTVAPADDFDGDDRPIDGNLDGDARADMGADEFVPASIYLPVIFAE